MNKSAWVSAKSNATEELKEAVKKGDERGLTISIDKELHRKLKIYATTSGKSIKQILCDYIADLVK